MCAWFKMTPGAAAGRYGVSSASCSDQRSAGCRIRIHLTRGGGCLGAGSVQHREMYHWISRAFSQPLLTPQKLCVPVGQVSNFFLDEVLYFHRRLARWMDPPIMYPFFTTELRDPDCKSQPHAVPQPRCNVCLGVQGGLLFFFSFFFWGGRGDGRWVATMSEGWWARWWASRGS